MVVGCTTEHEEVLRAPIEMDRTIPGLVETRLSFDDAEPVEFGLVVAAAGTGVLVGAPSLLVDGKATGGVVPFVRSRSGWIPGMALAPPEASDGMRFGSVIAATSESVAIGAPYATLSLPSVWLFDLVGDAWSTTPSAILHPTQAASAQPAFGRALALTDDLAVIGSSDENGAGFVYMYEKQLDVWSEAFELVVDPPPPTDALYGSSVAGSGNTIVVGAPNAGASGAIYLFERASNWSNPEVILGAEDAGAPNGAQFGQAIALDATNLYVGAPGENDSTGAVYTWKRAGNGKWTTGSKLVSKHGTAADGLAGDGFGMTVALSLGRLFVGVPYAHSNAGMVEALALNGSGDEDQRLAPDPTTGDSYFGGRVAATSFGVVVGSIAHAYEYELAPGAGCSSSSDCESGYCTEGVCCNSHCDETCVSCLASRKARGPDGQCGPVRLGTDPLDTCDLAPDACGTTGLCDGYGECAFAAKSVHCLDASCSNETEASASFCDGKGECPPGIRTACRPGYLCNGPQCSEACSDGSECAAGYYCFESACVSGPRCSQDRLSAFDAQGVVQACTDIYCRAGRCPTNCERTSECVAGLCHPTEHVCVDENALSPEVTAAPDASCTCRLTHATDCDWKTLAFGVSLAGWWACRRARRRSYRTLANIGVLR